MQQPSPPNGGGFGFDKFVGGLLKTAEEASKAASDAADQWVNTGWELKKRAGQVIPEVQPTADPANAQAVAASPPGNDAEAPSSPVQLGLMGASGSLAQMEDQASALLATEGAVELQAEFCSFLAPREGSSYRTTEQGEIVFASREDLAALVTEFSYGKLKELAAASRALARYVDDLEAELESADDAVVQLRRDATSGATRLAEATRANAELQSKAGELEAELAAAGSELALKEAALEDAEKAAERAAAQILDGQSLAEASARATQGEATARAVRLEAELMAAEEEAEQLSASKSRLEQTVSDLRDQQQLASAQRLEETARVRALEGEAEAAEARAEEKARQLAESEESAAKLQRQLDEIKAGLSQAPANAANVNGARAASAPAAPRAGGGPPPSSSPSSAGTLDAEAASLTKEVEAQLQRATGGVGGTASSGRRALSSMKKADLVAECEERKLNSAGSVAELRAQLRVERKRDAVVAELVERGWSERQSRGALNNVGWDVDKAIQRLQKKA